MNTNSPTELDPVIFTAIVTDVDGLANIAGGVLEDPDSPSTYGPFVPSGAGSGTYTFSATAATISVVRPLDSPSGGSVDRDFRAAFLDAEGHRTAKLIRVSFGCMTDGERYCASASASGVCVDTSSDADNCGSCGHVCEAPGSEERATAGICRDSECSACVSRGYGEDCEPACADVGLAAMADDPGCDVEGATYTCSCDGPACAPGPENTAETCSDNCSNDGDDYVDCEDYDCCDVRSCPTESACGRRPPPDAGTDAPADARPEGGGTAVFEGEGGIAIPDNDPAGITSAITIPASTRGDVHIQVVLEHTYPGDLDLWLTGPGEMEWAFPSGVVSFNVGLSPQPTGDLGGTWTLHIVDMAAVDTGTLIRWSLTVGS